MTETRPAKESPTAPRVEDSGRPGRVALAAFWHIAGRWNLDAQEQMMLLGLENKSTLRHWKAGKVSRLRRDTLERLSYIIGIFRSINTLLPSPKRADAWMRASNKATPFGGSSALRRMIAGNISDLYEVRRHLEGELQG